ncbi:MAG: fatty acid desaturase family protein [Burkholderiaceae bacterium]|nr:fatty acid desaturase family protein [Burkholderiaceae bacterium]
MSVTWNSLPREELMPFLEKSNWTAARMLAFNWGLIAAGFALVMWAPAWYTVLLAMLVLGGRQLGLGILTHECAHRSFVKSAAVGEWIGNWLCGAPMLVDLAIYRRYHMTHHVKTGTDGDPDLGNYANYPVSRQSLLRKFGRDLVGLSGLKAALSLAYLYGQKDVEKMLQGYSYQNKAGNEGSEGKRPSLSLPLVLWNARRSVLANALMLTVCWLCGHPLAYLLWPASWLTTYMLYSRIRNAAEHGALSGTRSSDMWSNTRTVQAAWWERLTVAPNFVNFHFEHHLAPTVPSYNLPKLHRRMVEIGVYGRATMEPGYWQVLKRMTAVV